MILIPTSCSFQFRRAVDIGPLSPQHLSETSLFLYKYQILTKLSWNMLQVCEYWNP